MFIKLARLIAKLTRGRVGFITYIYQRLIPLVYGKTVKSHGIVFNIKVGDKLGEIPTELILTGEHEPVTTKMFYKILRNSPNIVIDVGANIGYFSLLAASIVGYYYVVIAIEPDKDNVTALESNTSLNPFYNIDVVNAAASNKVGYTVLYKSNGDARHSMFETGKDYNIVKMDTLDNILPNGNVRLLKTDTEGNELQVLQGAECILRRSNNIFVITEVYPVMLAKAGTTVQELWDFLVSVGMKQFWIIDDHKGTIVKCTGHKHLLDVCNNSEPGINLICTKTDELLIE